MTDQGGTPQDGVPMDSAAQNQAPPGWYPDGLGNQRWWDGSQWAQHVPPAPVATANGDPKTIAAVIHASGVFFGFVGPLIGYLVYPEDQFIRENSRNALNFQLTAMVAYVVSLILMIVLIGFLTFFGVLLATIVLHIVAAVEATSGKTYEYPLTIQFLKK